MDNASFNIRPDIEKALVAGSPVLALESTILAHGMPYPENLAFAKQAEQIALNLCVLPATIAIINGDVKVGLNREELKYICNNEHVRKTSLREISGYVASRESAATTVSATIHLARLAGIRVFTTGGIGGVHRNCGSNMDISQDLTALSNVPIIVVSAGAKAILDLPKTLEALETLGVAVIGYKTKEFPAFYSRSSGLKLNNYVNEVNEIIKQYNTSIALKINSASLVVNPIEEKDEIHEEEINSYLHYALQEADSNQITGKRLTPFLLKTIAEKSKGKALKANVSLALNNIKLGSEIALQLAKI